MPRLVPVAAFAKNLPTSGRDPDFLKSEPVDLYVSLFYNLQVRTFTMKDGRDTTPGIYAFATGPSVLGVLG